MPITSSLIQFYLFWEFLKITTNVPKKTKEFTIRGARLKMPAQKDLEEISINEVSKYIIAQIKEREKGEMGKKLKPFRNPQHKCEGKCTKKINRGKLKFLTCK